MALKKINIVELNNVIVKLLNTTLKYSLKSQHNVMIFVRCFENVAAKKFQILIRYPLVNLNQNPKLSKIWRVKA